MQKPDPASIPNAPGVYLYKNEQGKILYVGKARILRRRVLSYFRSDLSPKTRAMLSHAASVEFLTTTTEKEALLLEANLIKKHHPHYNIDLKDDKQYFLFRIDPKAPYPRLEIVRQIRQDQARYFGPFTAAQAARDTWKLLHRTFGLRRCSDRALRNRVRPCLYHHLGQCLAPCTGSLDPHVYARAVEQVCALLAGRAEQLISDLRRRMEAAAEALAFEEAALLRDQIRAIERTVEQQAVVLPGETDTDALGLWPAEKGMALGLVFVRNGAIGDARSFYWPNLCQQDSREILLAFLSQFYALQLPPPRILLPRPLQEPESEEALGAFGLKDLASLLSEQRGRTVRFELAVNATDKRLIEIAEANARDYAQSKALHAESALLVNLQKALHLPRIPRRIECVDVSHCQGQDSRVGLVVFEDGLAKPNLYRSYSMPALNDDYATLAAWLPRRLQSGAPWPDLLLIDGGRGQVAAIARAMLEAGQADLFALAGIAKARTEDGSQDRRAGNVSDRIFLPGRTNPLAIRPGSQELLFLQKIRDATHRLAISRHRQAHRKSALASDLLALPGIGQATAKLLWEHFASLEALCRAELTDLAKIPGIGLKRAQKLVKVLATLATKKTAPERPGR
ncbi:MAG: excinuclease ABC subunit UvrC [Desulfovibrio sp.]|nr:excinuclease ABC subunit UvrC [Desulfovibrio sp.]